MNASKQGQSEKNSNPEPSQNQAEVSSEFRQELTHTLSVAIDIGYWEWDDVDNKPAYLSDEMAVFLGMTPVALSEMYQCEADYFHLVHPHDLSLYCENLSAILDSKHARSGEFLRLPHRSTQW